MALIRHSQTLARVARSAPSLARSLATPSANSKPPTAIVLMNMGGPSTIPEVGPFLSRLFHDHDLIPLPFQKYMAPWIAKRRTPQIEKQYEAIGGGSPIRRWTAVQGEMMVALLDELSPSTAPHKAYTAFRYADPLTEECLAELKRDGVKRAVAFTQYPQYSCSTTGSSLNELWRGLKEAGKKEAGGEVGIEWSVIDRWPTQPKLVEAIAESITKTLESYEPAVRDNVVILFSAHSLPLSVVNRGDPYITEVAATVLAVMEHLGNKNPYRLSWQSKVGPSAWQGPQTIDALKGLHRNGQNDVVMVPVAFTSDHIETLFELDQEYGQEMKELGMNITRSPSLNDSPTFARALADLASQHLADVSSGRHGPISPQLALRCPGCTNDRCKGSKEFFAKRGLETVQA
ncbi:ferrochelatase [Phaffia rhodozyma]|uniref:Ferrochelatase n=1 Tax=Phaffia rhodozyma TaxID=264483 RepID=A0A0F7SFW2_PHARH|nr:ferrochelatase [Phaffia rhodozyma]